MKLKLSPGKTNSQPTFSNYNPSIEGATPEEKAKRARAKETTFIVDITFQLPELYGHDSRNKKWDVTQLLPIVKVFYQTALHHDSNIGLAPVTDHDIIEHDIAYGQQMSKLLEDPTVKSFTDARILKYFYLANPRTLYDRNCGVVYSKVKIRTGKTINKDKLLAYTCPIYEEWANPGGHGLFVDSMQKINQYRIGCFVNICPTTNFNELAQDFSYEASELLEQTQKEAL